MDTARVVLRPLRFDDEPAVEAWFVGLSPISRALRFFSPVPRLTTSMRQLLVADDRAGRVGVVAEVRRLLRTEIVGIAHLAELDGQRGEVAVAVADAWHGRGVGRRLLHELGNRARSAQLDELVAYTLPHNRASRSLFRTVFPGTRQRYDEGLVEIICSLRPDPRGRQSELATAA